MKVLERDERIVAIDQARRSVTIDLGSDPALEPGGYLFADRETVAYEAPTKRQVKADHLRTPPVGVTIIHPESGEHHRLGDDEVCDIGPETLVVVRTPVLLLVRPDEPGTIRRDAETVIDLDETTTVTLGFRSKADFPDGTMQVHDSAEGVARAISAASSAISVTSPDRTWPNVRDHPPRIELVSDPSADTTDEIDPPETDVELAVPEENALDYLLPTAPLAYYLGATVTVETGIEPQLRAGSVTERLGTDADAVGAKAADADTADADTPGAETANAESADRQASALLRRMFFLDCFARSAGQHGEELAEHHLLTESGLDAEELYEADIAERVRRYLALSASDVDRLDAELPTWHLGVHVRPTMDNVPSLSHHLASLADIYRPEAATLETVKAQFEWAQEQKVRGQQDVDVDEVWVSPEDRAATVGWQAPRRALGAFNSSGAPELQPREERELSITVARTARDMPGAAVVEQYRERDLPLSVEFVDAATVTELRQVFESDRDLVHVIGHHEPSRGIECRDGFLAAAELDSCNVETFFLNVCGSFPFGKRLVERGAAAGAVTTRTVTEESAASVGVNWARLISLGWSVERALSFVRRVDDPSGYVAVGDGTHIVIRSDSEVPAEATLTATGGEPSSLRLNRNGPRRMGSEVTTELSEKPHLQSTTITHEGTRDAVAELLGRHESPILYNAELCWELSDIF